MNIQSTEQRTMNYLTSSKVRRTVSSAVSSGFQPSPSSHPERGGSDHPRLVQSALRLPARSMEPWHLYASVPRWFILLPCCVHPTTAGHELVPYPSDSHARLAALSQTHSHYIIQRSNSRVKSSDCEFMVENFTRGDQQDCRISRGTV